MSVDWAGLAAALAPVPVEAAPTLVRQKSRAVGGYRPVRQPRLRGGPAARVVSPRSEAEVIAVLRQCHAAGVPVTARGAGTGNYGQAMPLAGGVVLDLMALDGIGVPERGVLRVGSGARLHEIERQCRPHGWELRMFPSTRRTASIGGFVAGGSGGIGSINHGQLRDPGNLLSARVVTMEPEPRVLELHGADVNRVHHAYGTNGIITELRIALARTHDWVDCVVEFSDFAELARFTERVAVADGLAKRLCCCVDATVAGYFRPLAGLLTPGHAVGLFLVGAESIEPFEDMLRAAGGRFARRLSEAEIERDGAVPAFEFTWNHTTLQALKVDRSITYLQVRFPAREPLAMVAEFVAAYGDELPMHLEYIRAGGEVACAALPLLRYTTEARLREIIAHLERRGCAVFDPHTYVLEDGGMKRTDPEQLAFKRAADPQGLLNPGKMRGWAAAA